MIRRQSSQEEITIEELLNLQASVLEIKCNENYDLLV